MNSLTVEDLLLLGHSTTSSIEQVGLIGRLSIVPDDKTCGNRMGTILFTDLDGQYSLPCNVDIMRKEILHCQVMITCWNYISCSETDVSYLEFSLKHVYRIDDTTVSLLEECLQLDDQKFTDSLICNPSLITPDQVCVGIMNGCVRVYREITYLLYIATTNSYYRRICSCFRKSNGYFQTVQST